MHSEYKSSTSPGLVSHAFRIQVIYFTWIDEPCIQNESFTMNVFKVLLEFCSILSLETFLSKTGYQIKKTIMLNSILSSVCTIRLVRGTYRNNEAVNILNEWFNIFQNIHSNQHFKNVSKFKLEEGIELNIYKGCVNTL